MESQDWVFAAETGEYLEMHISFERGGGQQAPAQGRQVLLRQGP